MLGIWVTTLTCKFVDETKYVTMRTNNHSNLSANIKLTPWLTSFCSIWTFTFCHEDLHRPLQIQGLGMFEPLKMERAQKADVSCISRPKSWIYCWLPKCLDLLFLPWDVTAFMLSLELPKRFSLVKPMTHMTWAEDTHALTVLPISWLQCTETADFFSSKIYYLAVQHPVLWLQHFTVLG